MEFLLLAFDAIFAAASRAVGVRCTFHSSWEMINMFLKWREAREGEFVKFVFKFKFHLAILLKGEVLFARSDNTLTGRGCMCVR